MGPRSSCWPESGRGARTVSSTASRWSSSAGWSSTILYPKVQAHLRDCEECREFRRELARQRRVLALILLVPGSSSLRDRVLSGGRARGAPPPGFKAGTTVRRARTAP
jgi:hypothetical protein